MRAAIIAACLMTSGSLPVAYARWSEPSTWGGSVPTSGPVVIPSGQTVLLDVSTASLGALTINGTLLADPSVDVGITAANIVVGATGTLQVGSESQRYTRNCTITLTGAEVGRVPRFVPVHDNPVTGKGRPARLAVGTGVSTGEVITLTFTTATTFTASSSIAGVMPSGTVGTYYNSWVQFMPTAGSTPWVAGDTVVISVGTQLGFANDGVGRSLIVQPGGRLKLVGALKTGVSAINLSAAAGVATLSMEAAPIGWAAGDSVVVGPTDFYGTGSGTPHATTLAANVSSSICTLSAGLNAARFGALQYPTDAGVSLSAGTFATRASPAVPTVLDQRASVINKTRNIVIQGANDSAWTSGKFGAHCMIMGLTSVAQMDGVEFRRVGQAGAIGRYPIHWHMLSYGGQQGGNMGLPSDGAFLGAIPAGNAYLRNCSVHTSGQRGTVIHGTHGVEVSGNVYHDITAHCIFLEDGAEQGNTITGNTIMTVRSPSAANRLLVHDGAGTTGFIGSSGIWLTNPRNTVAGNAAFDCNGPGLWNAIQTRALGLCIEVPGRLDLYDFTSHANNTGACCRQVGMLSGHSAVNSRGDQQIVKFGSDYGNSILVQHRITGARIWKNGSEGVPSSGGYGNSVASPRYTGWVVADNYARDFFGVVDSGAFIEDALGIGQSLNNATTAATTSPTGPRGFGSSYHFTLTMRRCNLFGYPSVGSSVVGGSGQLLLGGGMTGTEDLYIDPVEVGLIEAEAVAFYGSGGGWFTPPGDRGFMLSGAILDAYGYWTTPGNYVIRDTPFFTSGVSTSSIAGAGAVVGTATKFLGVTSFRDVTTPGDYESILSAVTFTRQDVTTGASLGTWSAREYVVGVDSSPTFKHAALPVGGRVQVDWTGRTVGNYASFIVHNGSLSGDTALVGLAFSAPSISSAVVRSYPTYTPAALQATASMAALQAATVASYWLDSASSRLWVKHVGSGYTPPASGCTKEQKLAQQQYIIQGA
jgi:hypothetical protein